MRLCALAGPVLVALAGLAAWQLFPNDLALLTRVVSAVILVLSLDLVVGYCGIATLGHAAIYGFAAYAAGIACVHGVTEPLALIGIGMLAGAFAGLVSGLVIVRGSGLTQLVLSIAVVQLVHELANKLSSLTGGSDGLSGITPGPVLGLFEFDLWGRTSFLFGLAILVVALVVLGQVVRSPFGLLCRAIREDPLRVRAMGAKVFPALLGMYVVSGVVAGAAGALAAVATGLVGLDSVSFDRSAQAFVMLVLGGTGTLYGGLIGASVYMLFEHVVSASSPFHWLILIGALLIAVVLFLPQGLQSLADPRRWAGGR